MGEPMLKTEEHFTYRDLKSWPEEERWELIGGEPFVAPFDVLLRASPDQAEDDVDTVLQPDLMVVCDPQKVQRNGVHGAPDWVLEILSPSTTWRDQTVKRGVYEKHGVKEYWILNPQTLDLTIFRSHEGVFAAPRGANLKDPVAVDLFPGLTLSLGVKP